MRYLTRDVGQPVLYTRDELAQIRLQEFAAYEGRDVARATLAKCAMCRLQALCWLAYRWSDASLGDGVEELVRSEAIASLLSEATATERDAWEAAQSYGIDTYEQALAAVASTLETRDAEALAA